MTDTTGQRRTDPRITVLHHFVGEDRSAMEALLDVVRPAVPGARIAERSDAQVRLRAKVDILSGDPPNVFETWPGQNLRPYLDADIVSDITDLWERAGYTDVYFDHAKETVRYDGRYRAIPTNVQRQNNLFYDVELLERAGVDPARLDTPESLRDALEAVEEATDAAGLLLPQKRPWPALDLWDMLVLSHGDAATYEAIFRGSEPARHRDIVDAALDSLAALRAHSPDDALYDGWQAGLGRFAEGDAAFFAMGDWAGGVLKNRDGYEYGSDWGCVPFPGTADTYQVVMDAFLMPSTASETDVTERVLREIGSAEAIAQFTGARGAVPPRSDVPTDRYSPFFRDQLRAYQTATTRVNATRGLGVPPAQRVEILTAIAGFLDAGDTDRATDPIVETLAGGN
ncbi:ABC transporter substrate-binding protein [Haloarcula litorea]|uniref:ABC transporter substrate-binding protein n=1 Tax=Haloarcula litorea TaxID=3032579 RepID=UPI0023E87094|nr:ABC transporter substrate-binding protein [Halomicroarcula sp. GDY20]